MTSNWYSMGLFPGGVILVTSNWYSIGLFSGGVILVTSNWYSMGLFSWWSHTSDFKLVIYGFFLVESYK